MSPRFGFCQILCTYAWVPFDFEVWVAKAFDTCCVFFPLATHPPLTHFRFSSIKLTPLHPPAPPPSYPAGVPTLQKQTFTGRYLPYKIRGRKYYISYVGQVWHLRARLGICRNRQSCKIFVSCVNFSRKPRSFSYIYQVYTHLNVNLLHNCWRIYTFCSILTKFCPNYW